MSELKRTISSVIYQLYANALLTCLLLAVSAYLLVSTFTHSPVASILAGAVAFGVGVVVSKIYRDKKQQAISIIHRTVGDTEYSLPLLDKSDLNIAEQLQLKRLNERIQNVRIPTVAFSKLSLYGLMLAIAIAVHYTYPLLQAKPQAQRKLVAQPAPLTNETVTAPVFRSAELRIQAPAYTGLPVTKTTDLNVTAISGSLLTWQVKFSNDRHISVRLANSCGEELPFRKVNGLFDYKDRLVTSGLYAIKAYWSAPVGSSPSGKDSLIYQSDFYRLEAQPDLAPKIEPTSKELYQYHYLKDPKTINISAKISDDFRVNQAFIVATVARGSGENVKFREVKIPLGQANFKEAQISKSIDLKALNFAPGDELYYYWAAVDNKQPEPNFAKSDTYFIVYRDTTKMEEAELATMAVNIMPEYFRSQRQIIIDTEKLIAKRNKIPKKPFNSTSNEIGFDQKVLRLRYGQYLGEEFETSIGGHELPANGSGDVLEGFVHKHDSKTEQDEPKSFAFKMIEKAEQKQIEQTRPEPESHDHAHGGTQAGDEQKDPIAAMMEQYVHAHDDAETNTFYEQSTRSLLKMALEQMWQSELHLRLYEPEKALPYEKKALEYLKVAQQKARTFVKKTGFDPPPIKEQEKRLTGELKNVNASFNQERVHDQRRIEQLVADVLGYLEQPGALTSTQRLNVQVLSNSLTDRVMNSGLRNWSVLSGLQKLAGGKALSEQEKQQLKTKLYELAGPSLRTNRSYTSERKLEQAFWKRLK